VQVLVLSVCGSSCCTVHVFVLWIRAVQFMFLFYGAAAVQYCPKVEASLLRIFPEGSLLELAMILL